MGRKIVYYIGLLSVSAICVYLFRYLILMAWFEKAEFNYTIVPFDVFSFLITSVITVWIGWYIAKKLTEQRFEKDFLIDDLKKMEEEVHQINRLFKTSASVDISLVGVHISSLHQIKQRFCDTDQLTKNNTSVSKLENSINELFAFTTNFDSNIVSVEQVNMQEVIQRSNKVIINIRHLIVIVNQR